MPYVAPSVGSSGLTTSSFADYVNYLQANFLSIFGAANYLGADTADAQDIQIRALQAFDALNAMIQVYGSQNPLTAIGPSLDLVGQLIGTARKSASFSTATVTISGTPGTVIANGVCQDSVGNYWNLPASVTISGSGIVNVTATAQQLGNITANIGTIIRISTPTQGWNGVTNPVAAAPGQPVEVDSIYRARLLLSNALPSRTLVAGTAAALAQLAGVTRSQVYENPTGSTDANGNPAHSITCVVEGGSSAAIAQAIYGNKGIGCLTNGTTTVAVTDPNNGGITENISFDILSYLPIYVGITVHGLAGFTTATVATIQSNIVNYLNSLAIGESVLYGELVAAALSGFNPDVPVFSIRALNSGAGINTTGTTVIFTNTVTVALATGLVIGQLVIGAGIAGGTTVANVVGTTITLSANATASGAGVPLTFFTVLFAYTDITVAFSQAAQGLNANVIVTTV